MNKRAMRTIAVSSIVVAAVGVSPLVTHAAPLLRPAAEPTPSPSAPVITDALTTANQRFVVTMKPGADRNDMRQHLASRSAVAASSWRAQAQVTPLQDTTYVVHLNQTLNRDEATALMQKIAADPAVASVKVDRRIRLNRPSRPVQDPRPAHRAATPASVPNDALARFQWDMFEAEGGINLEKARTLTTGKGTIVAVVDTGIVKHPDLDANRIAGYDFVSTEPGKDYGRDGDSYDPDPTDEGDWHKKGQGPCTDPKDPNEHDSPSSFHGTHVAGTIAAGVNGTGIVGVASDVKFFSARALGECGGWDSDIANAIRWSAGATDVADPVTGKVIPPIAQKADVINLSLGGDGKECSAEYMKASRFAREKGVTLAVAAGNEGEDTIHKVPANCPDVITVGASGPGADTAWYSNFGAEVDVTAPGGDEYGFHEFELWKEGKPSSSIISTINTSETTPDKGKPGYGTKDGTSMATPHVAGVVALMRAVNKNLTPAQIEDILKRTAKPWTRSDQSLLEKPSKGGVQPGKADNCGHPNGCGTGIIDAYAAVSAAKDAQGAPAPSPTPSASQTPTPTPVPSPTPTPTPSATPTPTNPSGDSVAPTLVVYPPAVSVRAGEAIRGIRVLARDNRPGVRLVITDPLPSGLKFQADQYQLTNSQGGYIQGSIRRAGTTQIPVKAVDAAGNESDPVTVTITVRS